MDSTFDGSIKRSSVSSRTSINPTQGLIPQSPTDLYLKRFQGWTNVVKNLVRFFEIQVDQERRSCESQLRITKELTLTSPHLFEEEESFQRLYHELSDIQLKKSQEHASSADMIESQILPILKSLLVEVKKKAFDADKEWVAVDKDMARDRDTYVKLVSNLRACLMRHQWRGDASSPSETGKEVPKDPWMADQLIKKHAANCFSKQSEYRKALIEQQKACGAFETIVYQNIKVALSLFFDHKSKTLSNDADIVRTIKTNLAKVDIESDWDQFTRVYPEVFLQAEAAPVRCEDLTYDGYDDPLTKVVEQGTFYKKESGMFKTSWKPFRVILTGAGYFHMMSQESIGEGQTLPELSLDLSECTVGPLMLNDKEPEEFTISEKSGGLFGRDVKHKVKGKDMEISAKWWSLLSDHVRSIKKSVAAQEQIMDETGKPISHGGTSDDQLSHILQKPLQPRSTGGAGPPPSGPVIANTQKLASPSISHYGSTSSVNSRLTESVTKKAEPPVPLPPRRQPAITPHPDPIAVSVPVELPTYNPPPVELPSMSPVSPVNPASGLPLTVQMEMALQAAVDESKGSSVAPVANPWGDEENVWS